MRDYRISIKDILDAMDKIEQFTLGMSYDDFCLDEKTISAVRDKLIIIGEAVKQVPTPVREQYPSIDWKTMAGMRDILTHAYFRTDCALLYQTITKRMREERALLWGVYQAMIERPGSEA